MALNDSGRFAPKTNAEAEKVATGGYLGDKAEIAALDPIADPAAATAEDVAEAYNALLAAIKA